MSRKRKNYSPQEKVVILKRHLLERVPVFDLCDEHGFILRSFAVGRRNSLTYLN